MTDNEIRIAIAEACGLSTKLEQFGGVMAYRGKDGYFVAALPNYVNDLNAMHEAEKVLFQKCLRSEYDVNLCDICRIDGSEPDSIDDLIHAICATARQRAEAFLCTIGKWKDEGIAE